MPPVDFLLLRGLAREAAHWGSFVDRLKDQKFTSSVECIDLPGSGRFNRLTSPLSIAENAEFVLSQLEEGKGRKVIFSVSLGSMVAVEMLQRRPDLFKMAFVINTSFANLSPLYHRLQLQAFKQFFNIGKARADIQKREYEILKMVSNCSDRWLPVSQAWADIAETRPMLFKNFARQLVAAATYRIAKNKPDVSIVVLRSLGDKMVDPSCSEALARHWDLPLYSHPSAGHDLCIDDPEWVIEKISKELDQPG